MRKDLKITPENEQAIMDWVRRKLGFVDKKDDGQHVDQKTAIEDTKNPAELSEEEKQKRFARAVRMSKR